MAVTPKFRGTEQRELLEKIGLADWLIYFFLDRSRSGIDGACLHDGMLQGRNYDGPFSPEKIMSYGGGRIVRDDLKSVNTLELWDLIMEDPETSDYIFSGIRRGCEWGHGKLFRKWYRRDFLIGDFRLGECTGGEDRMRYSNVIIYSPHHSVLTYRMRLRDYQEGRLRLEEKKKRA